MIQTYTFSTSACRSCTQNHFCTQRSDTFGNPTFQLVVDLVRATNTVRHATSIYSCECEIILPLLKIRYLLHRATAAHAELNLPTNAIRIDSDLVRDKKRSSSALCLSRLWN
jgi:hypothetical protein